MSEKSVNIIRWVFLLPCVILTWHVLMFVFGAIPHLIYTWGWEKMLTYLEIPLVAILGGFVLPCVAVYFVAKHIAPNHKKAAAWGSMALRVLWNTFLFFALSRMAY